MSNLRRELSHALRNLAREPLFAGTILLTLATGIGANVAIFSVVNGILLRPLPFAEPSRVIQLSRTNSASTVSEPELVDLERDAQSFSSIGAFAYADGNIAGGDDSEAERVRISRVTPGFFETLRPSFHLGRAISESEDRPGAPDVAVISYGLWQRRFGMDPRAVGQEIVLDDTPRLIVGVLPQHFNYPAPNVAVWVPLRLDRQAMVARNNHYLQVIGRLADGVGMASAYAEVRALRDRWMQDFPESYRQSDPLQVDVAPIRERIVGTTEPYLVALLGAVAFVLLIACANVANLLVARGEARRREMAIRSALGATRRRLAVQLSLESAILMVAGGLSGIVVAVATVRGIVAAAPASIPRTGEIRVDTPALLFAAGLSLLTGALFSLAPILRGAGTSATIALSSGSRNGRQSGGPSARRTRIALVVSEITLAVIMLAGAGIFLRTLIGLQQTKLGFAADDVVTARLSLPRSHYDGIKAARFFGDLVDRTNSLPGVASAAAVAWTPLIDGGGNWSIEIEGQPVGSIGEAPTASPQQVTPGFFSTMSIPLIAGRDFTSHDGPTSELVAIVNETFALRMWSTRNVVGRRFRMATPNWPLMAVVGLVGDTRAEGITEPVPPIMYFPHAQARISSYFTSPGMTLVVRSADELGGLVSPIKQIVRDLDPNVPVSDVRAMVDIVESTLARHRFTTLLLNALAAFALLLAAIGIHGVISYGVTLRQYEFGVRLALGSGRGRVFLMVLREGLMITGAGLAIGFVGVFLLARILRNMLAELGSMHASTLLGVALLLGCVSALAILAPVRRATAINPTQALRNG